MQPEERAGWEVGERMGGQWDEAVGGDDGVLLAAAALTADASVVRDTPVT